MSFAPRFQLTPNTAKALMQIEAARQAMANLPLTTRMLTSLRESARLQSTHYSTQIEGNRLTEVQVREVLQGGQHFPGRERDECEVKNYFRALEFVESQAQEGARVSIRLVQRIHGLAFNGKFKATPWRDGQNVIRDGADGRIVYLPPEAPDVPGLMKELVDWTSVETKRDELPIPVIAALVHYQFATIHPYYDGNGRTARLLTTFLLHRYGYGLKGIYALEAYYAQRLSQYYKALTLGENHNYYEGRRAEADVTPFIDYFVLGMAASFTAVKQQAEQEARSGSKDQANHLRELSPQQRSVLELFQIQATITSKEIAAHFGFSTHQASRYCRDWVDEGFFLVADPAKRSRRYRLAPDYEELATSTLD